MRQTSRQADSIFHRLLPLRRGSQRSLPRPLASPNYFQPLASVREGDSLSPCPIPACCTHAHTHIRTHALVHLIGSVYQAYEAILNPWLPRTCGISASATAPCALHNSNYSSYGTLYRHLVVRQCSSSWLMRRGCENVWVLCRKMYPMSKDNIYRQLVLAQSV